MFNNAENLPVSGSFISETGMSVFSHWGNLNLKYFQNGKVLGFSLKIVCKKI